MDIMTWPGQAGILHAIQSIHNPILDILFGGFTFLGGEAFYIFALSILFWCVDKRFTYRLSVVFILSSFLNEYLKEYFHTPRPSHQEFRVLLPQTGGGFAFPSGHAQNSTTFWGYSALKVRKRWFTALAVAVILMISFSRLYLAVHWPIDVLGGLVIGLALLAISYPSVRWLDRALDGSFWPLRALLSLLPLSLLGLSRDSASIRLLPLLAGLGLGYVVEIEFIDFSERAGLIRQVLKVAVGLVGLAAVRGVLSLVLPNGLFFTGVRYFALGVWATLLAPLVFTLLWPYNGARRRGARGSRG